MKVLHFKVYICYIRHKVFYGVVGLCLFDVRFKQGASTHYYHANCTVLFHIFEILHTWCYRILRPTN